MIRRPPRSTLSSSSAASDVYKRQVLEQLADALLVAVAPDDDVGVALDGALEDAEDVDAAAELVGHRLEHEGDGRLGDVAGELDLGVVRAEGTRCRDRIGGLRQGGRRGQA